jgi:TonB family protein
MLSARERRIAYWAIAAALLLHIAIAIVCIVDWAALLNLALAQPDVPEAIPVTLVYEPPPPPPKPQVQPEPPKPQPQPPITPRMSGADEKTEAKIEDTPQPALPQPKSPPPEPAPQQKKPAPTRAGNKEPASVAPTTSAEREAAAAPETRKQTPPAPLFHTIRLPSQHGGTGERDTAGDPYLNHLLQIVARNRIYPPASEFPGGAERTVVYDMLIDPSGTLVQIKLVDSSGSSIADEAAGNMLRNSTPFPPLPADWPHFRASIIIEMTMYSNQR